jgi:hypothetical protein
VRRGYPRCFRCSSKDRESVPRYVQAMSDAAEARRGYYGRIGRDSGTCATIHETRMWTLRGGDRPRQLACPRRPHRIRHGGCEPMQGHHGVETTDGLGQWARGRAVAIRARALSIRRPAAAQGGGDPPRSSLRGGAALIPGPAPGVACHLAPITRHPRIAGNVVDTASPEGIRLAPCAWCGLVSAQRDPGSPRPWCVSACSM